ncbi:glycoside hydrolase family 38 C-terminal domain-containing protein [Nereida sp. MMG025]|uniref:alpha-mannosidase n=1 Tax=Nereida sp. MMG025 TaxID=2909981 RepID=UPI001F174B3F|nr:glycoside hydrolase family 38 C-terminal domain-containing protein [Nereida sp. MMG025]MCF6445878.1 glycosyl hydrolase-related protein [Nereida sp. MMG025]
MTTTPWPFTVEKLAARLSLIAPYVYRRRQPLAPFKIMPLTKAMIDAPICSDPTHWDEVPHQSYWGHADLNFVMKSAFEVPRGWSADHIALHLPLGVLGDIFNHPEALVHVDTVAIGSADRYHHTIPLPADLVDDRSHVLSLHGWTGLAGWPPDPSCKAKLYMGEPALVERDPAALVFVQLANTVLDAARTLGYDSAQGQKLITSLDDAVSHLDTRAPIADAFYAAVPKALDCLQGHLARADAPLDVTLHGIGHAHMDIAYLWPIDQIRLKNARTYTNVLRLMEADPDYIFSHSQPQLYAYTQRDYPAIFDRIKARVAEGRWEVMGGMWVEPDLNLSGAEALVRQLTLGRGYFKQTFGDVETPALWLPDTFGFPAQVPQLMKLAGLDWFVTNKLNWNQYNAVPSTTHKWQGLDGTRVLAHILTTPRDVQYLPFPTNYKSDLSAAEVLGTWTHSTAQSDVRDLPICYGYGDGGGGPTEDLLAKAQVFKSMPGMPQFKHSTVRALFENIEKSAENLPVWQGEHYMEGHRGTYTSQGWIKRANRKAEWALHEAEALAAMAGLPCDLSEAWQLLCLNQFHDIITGTSVTEVFEDARRDYAHIATLTEAAAQTAIAALAAPDASVINTAPTTGPRLALTQTAGTNGQPVDGGTLVLFDQLESYATMPLSAASAPAHPATCTQQGGGFVLENAFVKVALTGAGHLSAVIDKTNGRNILAKGEAGNTLIAFEDRPICWDAWDIDPTYEDRCESITGDTHAEITETGPLRAALRVTTRWRSSTITQDIQLCAHSARLDFVTDVDWHEQHTLLKAAFPTRLSPKDASFDVQWGRVCRSISRDTAFDAARFEVPAHKWAAVSDGGDAVAVLNDCKYGYDVLGGRIRITLIKSATSPDPTADQGHHSFTYALLPFDAARPDVLDHAAYDLNAPLRVLTALQGQDGPSEPTPPLVRSDAANIIVETVKPADNGKGIILRLFEAHGTAGDTTLRFGHQVARVHEVSIFEDQPRALPHHGQTVTLTFAPFKIRTLRVEFSA